MVWWFGGKAMSACGVRRGLVVDDGVDSRKQTRFRNTRGRGMAIPYNDGIVLKTERWCRHDAGKCNISRLSKPRSQCISSLTSLIDVTRYGDLVRSIAYRFSNSTLVLWLCGMVVID